MEAIFPPALDCGSVGFRIDPLLACIRCTGMAEAVKLSGTTASAESGFFDQESRWAAETTCVVRDNDCSEFDTGNEGGFRLLRRCHAVYRIRR